MELNEKLKELLTAINDGDRKSFVKFMELTQNMLLKTAYAYLRDRMLSEDIVNETYEILVVKHHALKKYDNIAGWLKTVVINKSINLLHKRKREILSKDLTARAPGIPDTDENIFVRECLGALCEDERTVLLYRANGFTINEIAKALNCSVKKVRVKLDKAKAEFNRLYIKGGLPHEK